MPDKDGQRSLLPTGARGVSFRRMGWQDIAALAIVAMTAAAFVWSHFRPRKFNFKRDTHCGCVSPSETTPGPSIVFHARRGERPQVLVKMK